MGANKDMYESLRLIGLISMHDAVRVENFILRQILSLTKYVARRNIRMSFADFRTKMDTRPFNDVDHRQLSVPCKEHGYGCLMGFFHECERFASIWRRTHL